MKQVLYQYEIYPMIFPVGKPVTLTVKPLGKFAALSGSVTVRIHAIDSGSDGDSFTAWNVTECIVSPDADGCIRFPYTAQGESEQLVRLYRSENGSLHRFAQLSVFALLPDLARLIPLRGDFHMHTCRSDGRESPEIVCANYRKNGYDFIVVTDHGRYYPSLEAIADYAGTGSALTILPGEEVHLPGTDVHIVNAGGLFSVNGLLPTSDNWRETDGDPAKRAADPDLLLPPMKTREEYEAEVAAIEKTLGDLPENVNRHWFAVCMWGFDRIREADGVGIFAHPYWISDLWQIPEAFTFEMMKRHPFDAFEVLGGENYFEQNGLQTSVYYDEYRSGRIHAIVGSTDSHGSTEHNRNALICSTIVFAEANERAAILDAVRQKRTVAVDTISAEYRLVGEHRYQRYGAFLMENYYPLHDRCAAFDGEVMRRYATGDASADEVRYAAEMTRRMLARLIERD